MSEFELTVIPGARLREAPILLLIHFHNALRQELVDLRRLAAEALDGTNYGRIVSTVIRELRRRFEFLKLVYKYHSVAEDEVIFRALDVHVKNVVSAYTLEHTSTHDIMDSIFHYLDVLKKEDERHISKAFQELVYFIGTLQTSICKHMAKEEEQVFPLLTQQFSTEVQAAFVWQFICSVPMLLLEDFFRWMNTFLSSDDRENVLQCIKQVVPKDLLLQRVVISCIKATEQTVTGEYDKYGKGSLFLNDRANFQKILEVYKSEGHSKEAMKPSHEHPVNTSAQRNPLDSACLWHIAYHKDLLEAAEDLYSIRDSNNLSGLAPTGFPVYSYELQLWLLYTGLEMMPLGLLKCTVTWFSSHLTEDESKSILHSIKQGGHMVNKSLSSLLYEWVRIGYSGKTSIAKFREELHAAFENRSSFLSEQIKNTSAFPYLQLNNSTSYSSGMSFHVFFPQKQKISTRFSTYVIDNNNNSNTESSSRSLESKPVDHIIFFHIALKKDMEYLVSLSANLAENVALFTEFYQRFHLVRVLHKVTQKTQSRFQL